MAKKHLNLNQFQLSYEDSPYHDADGGVVNGWVGTTSPIETTIRAFPNDDQRYFDDDALGTLVVKNLGSSFKGKKGEVPLVERENQIVSLHVDEDHRGKGVGSALMGSLMNAHKEGKLIGSKQVPLYSYTDYTPGDKFKDYTQLTPEQKAFVDRRLKNY